jgi:hypothetical protein
MYLISNSEEGYVTLRSYPGHVCIGTGCFSAEVWLNHRRQVLGMSVLQSVYHAFEAKQMAESAPGVNKNLDLLIASADGSRFISNSDPSLTNGLVSVTELEEMYIKYGPQSTDILGHPKK